MEKATGDKPLSAKDPAPRPRGPKNDTKRVTREEVLPVSVPPGSRFKGYKDCFVRDLVLRVEVVRYRRGCWVTPQGHTITALLPAGT
jgi:hypothetical protein